MSCAILSHVYSMAPVICLQGVSMHVSMHGQVQAGFVDRIFSERE